jgi:hypothetical protein
MEKAPFDGIGPPELVGERALIASVVVYTCGVL